MAHDQDTTVEAADVRPMAMATRRMEGRRNERGADVVELLPELLLAQALAKANSSSSSDGSEERGDEREGPSASLRLKRGGFDAANPKLRDTQRYLKAARALYELQYQSKRPSAILKMKPNTFGLKSGSTFDTLVALTTPLRPRQVLDDWSAHEIGIFRDAFQRFGRQFHSIAEQLPNKSVRDVIACYYIWKKHGKKKKSPNASPAEEIMPEPEPELSSESIQNLEKLRARQACMKEYMQSSEALYGPPISNHKRVGVSEFGFQKIQHRQAPIHGSSSLRLPSAIDSWTPYEIRVFEVALECFGKEFHLVAEQIRTKSCREVIAFYYLWKKNPHYQAIKNRHEKPGPAPRPAQAPAEEIAASTL